MEPGVHHVEPLNSLPGFIRAPVVVAQHLKEKDSGGGILSKSVQRGYAVLTGSSHEAATHSHMHVSQSTLDCIFLPDAISDLFSIPIGTM